MNQLKYAESSKAMVVTGHDQATQTAIRILESGGSIADAAVAGAAVLSVALPHACGLGGDAFILVHDAKTGSTQGINASGMSPALAVSQNFPDGLKERGPLSCNVPGMVAGWQALHERHGSLSWEETLQPAIDLATSGVKASNILSRATQQHHAMLASDPGSSTLFLQEGQALKIGDVLKQPALARTLKTIATQGGSAFYQGEIARSIAQACEAAGGLIRESDLAAYKPEWVNAISTTYGGHEVRTMPPNSYGLYLLLQLMALEDSIGKHAEGLDSPARIARLIHAAQAAFSVGSHAVADPDPRYAADTAALLLGPEGKKRLQKASPGRPANRGGTAVITIADKNGNAITIIQSVFLVFGSGISDANTGVLLNNRLYGFTQEENHPNAVGPHKRPAHTLCPAMVFKDNHLRYALTTPGGPGQTLTLAQVMQALIEEGSSLPEAICAPRWTMDLSGASLFEDTMQTDLVNGVRELGVPMKAAELGSPFFGSVKGVSLEPGGLLVGAADDRRDATARGLT